MCDDKKKRKNCIFFLFLFPIRKKNKNYSFSINVLTTERGGKSSIISAGKGISMACPKCPDEITSASLPVRWS